MTYTIRWKDCDKSEAVASHLEMKISKFEDFKFIIPQVKAEIVFYKKQLAYAAIVNLPIKGKGTLRAEAKANDVLTAINLVTEKMLDQLRRVKTGYEK